MTVSYVVLGCASKNTRSALPFCVFSWIESSDASPHLKICLSKNWKELIPDDLYDYMADVIEDWSRLSIDEPKTLIRMLSELSVGPIQLLAEGSIKHSDLNDLLVKFLGHDPVSDL